ncbi:hypothetical protein [Streptomyces tibetensis]|uniref:Delta-aminolevulinic acid dehydratase n=1 Tax=Streptomyces tibetensis TaxID=2382123 RepID=A0ABW6MTX2_9ACTN
MEPQARYAAVRRFLEGPPLDPADLSMVLLVTEEESDRPMPTLTVAQLPARVRQAKQLGIRSVKIFAESTQRDAAGEFSVVPDALMARAVRTAKDAEPEIAVMTETCLCSNTPASTCWSATNRPRRWTSPYRRRSSTCCCACNRSTGWPTSSSPTTSTWSGASVTRSMSSTGARSWNTDPP